MLTVLWLVLAALVIARMTLYFRDRIAKQDDNLDQQIYRLPHGRDRKGNGRLSRDPGHGPNPPSYSFAKFPPSGPPTHQFSETVRPAVLRKHAPAARHIDHIAA